MGSVVAAAAATLLACGCQFGAPAAGTGRADLGGTEGTTESPDLASAPMAGTPDLATSVPPVGADYEDPTLTARQVSYGLALRSASLKLLGDLPTSDEIVAIGNAPDPAAAYAARIDAYLDDARFGRQMISYFRNMFRSGGALPSVSLETAATFAASLVVSDQPFTNVLTADHGTCPTYANGTFTPADCNNVPTAAGVLTDPGVQALFVSNLAFRRARWAQETFACGKFPAEFQNPPQTLDNGTLYTSPWPFESIAGAKNGGSVDFLQHDTLVCANCHSTLNHIAPLFANFDVNGKWQPSIQVTAPVAGLPIAKPTDWLPQGEATAWRFGVAVSDLPSLGAAIANDGSFATCMVTRLWNWALSKEDVVDGGATVPADVLQPFRDDFHGDTGLPAYHLKRIVRAVYTSDDFVKF